MRVTSSKLNKNRTPSRDREDPEPHIRRTNPVSEEATTEDNSTKERKRLELAMN